eukprot:GHVQ01033700.1.p2 GENE.GHVQ01033700.1~~GHVQ01033700.1.p2  ORF type:complete len:108 (-),score=13.23 GHVQ01033700.1:2446-2769(-)
MIKFDPDEPANNTGDVEERHQKVGSLERFFTLSSDVVTGCWMFVSCGTSHPTAKMAKVVQAALQSLRQQDSTYYNAVWLAFVLWSKDWTGTGQVTSAWLMAASCLRL